MRLIVPAPLEFDNEWSTMISIMSKKRKIIFYYYYIYWFKNATEKMFQGNNVNGKKCDDQQDCRCAGAFCNLRSNEGKVYTRYGVRSMRQPCMVSVDYLIDVADWWQRRKCCFPVFYSPVIKRLIMVIDICQWIWQLELYSTSR